MVVCYQLNTYLANQQIANGIQFIYHFSEP